MSLESKCRKQQQHSNWYIALALYAFASTVTAVTADGSSSSSHHHWPHFYHLDESTHPTQSICANLSAYRNLWNEAIAKYDNTYSFIFAWDAPDPCSAANKFISVDQGKLTDVVLADMNDGNVKSECLYKPSAVNISDYDTINQLYDITIEFCEDGINKAEYTIIEMVLNKDFYFPMAVKLNYAGKDSENNPESSYIAYDIPCFSAAYTAQSDVCPVEGEAAEPKWTFWITREMQAFLGWSMIFLIVIACSLGYCINWLKKKKSEKIEKWREKEEKQREEREREKQEKKKRNRNKKRKSSKSKHRAHLDKHKRRKSHSEDHDYHSLQQSHHDQSSDDLLTVDDINNIDIVEELDEHKTDHHA